MERYEAYKDSGVEWIGEIPDGWVMLRLKSLLSDIPHALADGPFGSDMKSEEYQDSGVPITQLNNIKEGIHKDDAFKYVSEEKAESLSSHFIYPGELLMAKMMPAGRTCIVSANYPKYLLSSDSIRIVPADGIDRRFLCYAANAYANIEAELMSTGTTRVRINLGIVRNMQFAIPSLDAQQAIADYLDAKTAEIDALVADCEREVGLLREYRKAIITEAVTKGLDPDAPMRDSGVEWIGEIPEGWLISRLSSCIKSISSGVSVNGASHPAVGNEVGVLKTSSVYHDVFTATENKQVNQEELNRVKCPVIANRLIVSRMNTPEWVGACGYVEEDYPTLFLPDRLWQIEIGNQAICKYVYYWLQSEGVKTWISVIAVGTSGSMKNIAQGEFALLPIPLPLLDEQKDIIGYLDAKTAEIDALIEAKQSMADKLREYRRSLISEVVTGKFKVPGA